MKAKNVNAVLCKKFDDFTASIDDEHLRELVEQNAIITGGAIASMLLGDKVYDFDIYFRDHDTTLAVAQHYVSRFANNPPPRFKASGQEVTIHVEDKDGRVRIYVKSAGIAGEAEENEYEYFEQTDPEGVNAAEYIAKVLNVVQDTEDADKGKPKYRPVFLSSNAITLSHTVQLIVRFYGEPDQIHENYDFVHCTNYWTSWDRKLTLRPAAVESLLARELRYVGSKYPLCSIIRTRKFIQRSWAITAGQYLKMAMQLNELDLQNIAVLEDQLMGVDTYYFTQVIKLLKKRDPSRIDTAYLVELIDKIF